MLTLIVRTHAFFTVRERWVILDSVLVVAPAFCLCVCACTLLRRPSFLSNDTNVGYFELIFYLWVMVVIDTDP